MKLKVIEVNGQTYAELNDGKPVYVDAAGKEHSYDAPAMRGSLDRLNQALTDERAAKDVLEGKVKAFGDLDAEKAREALQKVQALEDKDLIDAGEAARLRKEINDEWQKKYSALEEQYQRKDIETAFGTSKFIKEKLAIPADFAQARFADHFKFKDGRMVAVDGNGNTIYGKDGAAVASFEEAIEHLVEHYPQRDSILKGSGHNGSGAGPVDGGGSRRTIKRSQLEAMNPAEQQKLATDRDVQIVD